MPDSPRSTLKNLLLTTSLYLLLATVVASALVTFAPHWWAGDLLVHFRIQYLFIGGVGLLAMAALKNLPLGLFAGAVLMLNIAPVYQYFQVSGVMSGVAAATLPASGDATTFKIAGANVFKNNQQFDDIARWIKREEPDVVVLVEATRAMQQALGPMLPAYQYTNFDANADDIGKLILSKSPLHTVATLYSTSTRSPARIVTTQRDGTTLNIAAVHALWPVGPRYTKLRDRELGDLANAAIAHNGPLVMLGDFNVSPFSMRFQQLLRDGRLRRASAGRGWLPSWPTFLLPTAIQIDHLLVNDKVQVEQLRVGDGIGSDHRWMVARIRVMP